MNNTISRFYPQRNYNSNSNYPSWSGYQTQRGYEGTTNSYQASPQPAVSYQSTYYQPCYQPPPQAGYAGQTAATQRKYPEQKEALPSPAPRITQMRMERPTMDIERNPSIPNLSKTMLIEPTHPPENKEPKPEEKRDFFARRVRKMNLQAQSQVLPIRPALPIFTNFHDKGDPRDKHDLDSQRTASTLTPKRTLKVAEPLKKSDIWPELPKMPEQHTVKQASQNLRPPIPSNSDEMNEEAPRKREPIKSIFC
eukprot:TRINITY_DN6045_c0_g2_i3.p1 TRINITY_DN6045_c0_g2~~TRINITY_DN6045_c0_g2_i3.p1  ORF type:complete len:252 (-),score=21.71 TRINITY_DN6045_c0_g2_i3:220-975(-)